MNDYDPRYGMKGIFVVLDVKKVLLRLIIYVIWKLEECQGPMPTKFR